MILKRFILIMAFSALLAPVSALAAEARFFSNLNDIPLMPGLYEVTKDSVSFDKAEGRIVETAAASETLNISQIRTFYAAALPQLGWTSSSASSGEDYYVRNGETLTMRMEQQGKLNIVHLSLSPAP